MLLFCDFHPYLLGPVSDGNDDDADDVDEAVSSWIDDCASDKSPSPP